MLTVCIVLSMRLNLELDCANVAILRINYNLVILTYHLQIILTLLLM
jgi:hypothetical protein